MDPVAAFHSYAAQAASAEEAPRNGSEPTTPEAKKGKSSLSLEEVHESIITTINACTNNLLAKIESNAKSIEDVNEKLQCLFTDMEEMKETVQNVKQDSVEMEKRIKAFENKVNDLEAHQRRWNLRLHGVREVQGENVRKIMTDICGTVVPEIASILHISIDTCHRLGVREEGRTRPIIIRFTSRDVANQIWKAAKASDFLQERRLRFSQDLTTRDKETRALLWPQVEAARKAGIKAFFVGAKAIIDGKVVKPQT